MKVNMGLLRLCDQSQNNAAGLQGTFDMYLHSENLFHDK